ncbi:leucyl aminopeptidase [Synechococcus sp. CS-197]|jgi:leucyl aminopeptidase|uniref:Probable cytosol aminopeptidase n=1 Tax=Synechococcus sp. (strain WH7803) TaxID=32051 RepID=AMPA_SYNPW|nr:leucyl aminopeptidase [Synechococcus sp. CS-197]A5GN62.1 RecName: Full=Probable cytosol aminopeptidase; AltName: Full=Leucine aminopeptidase; Short=LAP; AltName: Full=Leucyl aminopeptidase [Synechococcus sp. WH 7803]MCT0251269.1 leucyl aminopeptidase [Synechococcus sp. CS-197]CAK24377.1 Leucyl aminopeptidase [Synechococcus sp. WH 7803]
MKISLSPATPEAWSGSVLALGIPENDPQGLVAAMEQRFSLQLSDWLKQKPFSGKPGDCVSLPLLRSDCTALVLVGLGEASSVDRDRLRLAAAAAARAAQGQGGTLGLLLPWSSDTPEEDAAAAAEAVRLALYSDERFRSKPEPSPKPDQLELLGSLPGGLSHGLEAVHPVCAGVELARELVAAPPNSVTPAELARTASHLAHEHGLELTILERSDCEERGMGSFLSVCQGSDMDPKFIHLTYRPNDAASKRLVLVGKGLTFDSGGYNLKVGAAQIDMMKFDMGGSAAVFGAMRAIAELRPAGVEVHMLVASCENMINGSAVHPGDIVTASNGTTIEINNTDAEGRLTLADALVYACKLKPDAIVDLATLTGACVIALGDEIAGLWSGDDSLSSQLEMAAQAAGEGLWRMPLHSPYRKGLKSLLADMKNTGPRPGGSITAALFLKEFVDAGIPWAHIDIAGTVWSDKGRGLDPSGATGYGVRTLVNWITNQANT